MKEQLSNSVKYNYVRKNYKKKTTIIEAPDEEHWNENEDSDQQIHEEELSEDSV